MNTLNKSTEPDPILTLLERHLAAILFYYPRLYRGWKPLQRGSPKVNLVNHNDA
jgi:hypothetical protein